jgi:hypothetical protein
VVWVADVAGDGEGSAVMLPSQLVIFQVPGDGSQRWMRLGGLRPIADPLPDLKALPCRIPPSCAERR